MTLYIYGIDLAQALNYTGIVITKIENGRTYLVYLRKFKNITYPELNEIIFDLFKRYPPKRVVADFTNERSFTQTMESILHPSFANPSSSDRGKWRTVKPVVFTQEMKLMLKQNAREMFENRQFVWPRLPTDPRISLDPRVWALISELKEQALRETATPGRNGQLLFRKSAGYDNDLVIALELNLYGAKEFLNYDPEGGYIQRPFKKERNKEDLCELCKNGNHPGPGNHDVIYHDAYGGKVTDCPCDICNPG